jgi:hypothetical protein
MFVQKYGLSWKIPFTKRLNFGQKYMKKVLSDFSIHTPRGVKARNQGENSQQ